jgi:hypothetical protein
MVHINGRARLLLTRPLPHVRRPRLCSLAALCALLVCVLLVVPQKGYAQDAEIQRPQRVSAVPVDPPQNPPGEESPPAAGEPATPPTIAEQIIRHTITFSSTSLIQAIAEAFTELGRKSIDGAVREVLPAMDGSISWLTEVDSQGLSKFPDFEEAVRAAWSAMLKVALVFAPLVLALTVLAILGGGGSAAEARAETVAQALQVLISYATAAASFYLLSLGIRASWGLTAFIWTTDLGVEVEPVRVLLGDMITTLSAQFLSMTVPLFAIYLLFFLVFLILALLGALGLALAATTALLALGVIIAPLMIALGSMPQFRWLTWTWTRLITSLLLLPVLNAILIKVASLMHVTMLGSLGGGSLASALLSFFVVAGALSLVIGINYKVGNLVFAPLMEIHRKAFGAAKTVALLAAAGAAVALGGPAVLKAGLGLGASLGPTGPATGGGAGGSLAGAASGGLNTLGSGSLGEPGAVFPARAASAALSTLAGMSGNPAVRGALSAAAQGFRNATLDNRRGPGKRGITSEAGGNGPGGVYSVSTQEAASSVLGDRSTPEAVRQLAARPEFRTALRSARRHAAGLDRAGIPFADQVKESGFPDAASYMAGLAFQVGHGHLAAGLTLGLAATPVVGPGLGVSSAGSEGREVLASLGQRLGALGGDGFPGVEGRMHVLKQAGWWSFNPSPDDPGFSRYAQAFLRAGQYLVDAGEEAALGALARAVQMARGDPTREITASEHMARIQALMLDGDFGKHQESLARIFEARKA